MSLTHTHIYGIEIQQVIFEVEFPTAHLFPSYKRRIHPN